MVRSSVMAITGAAYLFAKHRDAYLVRAGGHNDELLWTIRAGTGRSTVLVVVRRTILYAHQSNCGAVWPCCVKLCFAPP